MIEKGEVWLMNIVNYICIGDKEMRFDELTKEEQRMVATKLNEQAMRAIGYKRTEHKTA